MTHPFETPQLGLFAEDQSRVVLKPAQKVALAKLMEVLLSSDAYQQYSS